MFVKSLETDQFWNIKVTSFEISNPDSLGVKEFDVKTFITNTVFNSHGFNYKYFLSIKTSFSFCF